MNEPLTRDVDKTRRHRGVSQVWSLQQPSCPSRSSLSESAHPLLFVLRGSFMIRDHTSKSPHPHPPPSCTVFLRNCGSNSTFLMAAFFGSCTEASFSKHIDAKCSVEISAFLSLSAGNLQNKGKHLHKSPRTLKTQSLLERYSLRDTQ